MIVGILSLLALSLPGAAAEGIAPPSSPVLELTTVESGLLLGWEAPLSDGGSAILGYNIYVVVEGAIELLGSVAPNVFEYLVPFPGSEISMYFVAAINEIGEGLPSNPVTNYPYCMPLVYIVGPPDIVFIAWDCFWPPPLPPVPPLLP